MTKLAIFALACSSAAYGQWPSYGNYTNEQDIRANIRGGGGSGGKCTVEVTVDGVAEVMVRGAEGKIRTLSGAPSSWRRLECSGALPSNPSDFRFKGIDGRGRVELIRDPNGNRGVAVVRIDDSKGGSEGYTFDLTWGGWNGGSGNSGWGNSGNSGNTGWNNSGGGWGGSGGGWGSGSGNWNDSNHGNWGGGWNNGWGNDFNWQGGGRGTFSRLNDRYNLGNVRVSLSRANSVATLTFDTNMGSEALEIKGRITRVSGNTVYADVISGKNQGQKAPASGNMTITLDNNRVKSMYGNGDVANGRFNFNWKN